MHAILSSPTIACLAIADRAKINCRRRDIGFKSNSCLAFVNLLDILRNVEEWKRNDRSRNVYDKNEIPLDVVKEQLIHSASIVIRAKQAFNRVNL